jgi:hypothetical protein
MNEENNDLQDAVFGMFAAMLTATRAIVRAHPDKEALIRQMEREAEETIALLLARNVSDRQIEVFRETWNDLKVSPD